MMDEAQIIQVVNAIMSAPYAEKPKPPKTFNCGEFVRWMYQQAWNIHSPAILANPNCLKDVVCAIKNLTYFGNFALVDRKNPRILDVVKVIRGATGIEHIGLYLPTDGGLVVHCDRNGFQAEEAVVFEATGRRLEFWRHKEAPTWA